MRRLRVLLKVMSLTTAMLALVCLWLHWRDRDFDWETGATWGVTGFEVWKRNVAVEWAPRTPYRPQWAGQVNRYGFRYNLYSDGRGYAWAPLWAVSAAFAGASVVLALLGHIRGRARGEQTCPACGYDLRATPDRCPECGRECDRPPVA